MKSSQAYQKSKILAEKAAWDYVAALPEEKKFEVVTVNPGFIIGPNLNKCQFSSGDVVLKMLDGSIPALPLIQIPCVDVRDCAQAHLQAILVPEAAGRRFLCANQPIFMTKFCDILREKYGD